VRSRKLGSVLLVALFAALLIQLPLLIAARAADYEWFDPIVVVRRLLVEGFVEEPDDETLVAMQRAMIDAMIAELDDPFTEYVPPQDRDEFNKQLLGTYVGIGAEINIVDGWLTIATPMDDSPALEAGLMAGDTVLEIDGVSTYEMPVDECIERLTGEPGTSVTIHVRTAAGEDRMVTLVRRQIVTRTVKGTHRLGEQWNHWLDAGRGLAYIRITQFNESTVGEMQAALGSLQGRELHGLILDLRFDPGGGLDTAVRIADLFLESGAIVTVRGRDGERSEVAGPAGTLLDFPMVVMVNEASASASEIVAGALQENDRAKVLGERTFGKGSVQTVRILPDRLGTLKMTTAYYHLPSGRNIHRKPGSVTWGVDPDDGFRVPMTPTQYVESIRARRQYEIIEDPRDNRSLDWSDPKWIESNVKDIQLARAVEALVGRVATGEWPRVGSDASSTAAVMDDLAAAIEFRNRVADQLGGADERVRELRGLAAQSGQAPLLPDDLDLADGRVTVTDRDGRVVGVFRIVDGGLAEALEMANVEPIDAD
jgi:carboxyl-terminal processing protease